MALPVAKLATASFEDVSTVDGERARAYSAATNDPHPAFEAGRLAPPVFAVVTTWPALAGVVAAVVPPQALPMVVHGQQDLHLISPLVPGARLASVARAHTVRTGRSGSRLTVRVTSRPVDGGPVVVDHYVTLFVRGDSGGEDAGPPPPDHTLPGDGRGEPVGRAAFEVDGDQTLRYRDASGDHNPIHVDDAAARSVGLPGMVVHGLCTMAMAGRAVVSLVAGADPARLARLAVRFARPVFPGDRLTAVVYDLAPAGVGTAVAGTHPFGFEVVTASGEPAVTHGRAEVRS